MENHEDILRELERDAKARREEQRMQNRRNVVYFGLILFCAGVSVIYFADVEKTIGIGILALVIGFFASFFTVNDENPFNL